MIEDWLESTLGTKIKYTGNKKEIHICCPVCKESRYRLYINLDTGALYCHNCQFKGTIANLVQFTEGISYDEAKNKLNQIKTDIPISTNLVQMLNQKFVIPEFKYDKRSISLPEEYQLLMSSQSIMAKQAIQYLYSRKITKNQILKHKMGICLSGEYKNSYKGRIPPAHTPRA